MSSPSPADVMLLAKEQETRATKILMGQLPAPNPIIADMVKDWNNIGHDLEIITMQKHRLESQLQSVTNDMIKLTGAQENIRRNVIKIEWLFDVTMKQIPNIEIMKEGNA